MLCNPKIVKFSKEKDFFEEGCLSFPQMYADVEVGVARLGSTLLVRATARVASRALSSL